MLASELIKDLIPPLKTSDTGLKALNWMEEFKVTHLPIVNKEDFLGIISEDDILALNKPEEPIGNHALSLMRAFVKDEQHVYEVIKLITKMKLTLVPVLDAKERYLGVITLPDLMDAMATLISVNSPGGIIMLELNINDYSLSEIAQIVESNGASILSLYVNPNQDSTKMGLTIKVNKMDVTRILATFNRYEYDVKATYQESEFNEDMQDRYDSFMNYLNI
ncbi:MAG: CBS domain-containing protein [Bacteroidota bacterium]